MPKGDEFSIRLNKQVDEWAGDTRKKATEKDFPGDLFYAESQVMVKGSNGQFIYGKIDNIVSEAIVCGNMRDYLVKKKRGWNEKIMIMIAWDEMGEYMNSLSDHRVTNVVKFVHNWQNDGQQKLNFYGVEEETQCPAKCGEQETNLHFIACQSTPIAKSF